MLEHDPGFRISALAAEIEEALAMALDLKPDIVFLDAAPPSDTNTVGRFKEVDPRVRVIAFAVTETADEIIALAEAGVDGYLPKTVALRDLIPLIADIISGKQPCSGRVGASLLHRIAATAHTVGGSDRVPFMAALTPRQRQIADLIIAGLSNKEISRQLNIEVATTKTHVHNLLEKLNLTRRSELALRMHGDRGWTPLARPLWRRSDGANHGLLG